MKSKSELEARLTQIRREIERIESVSENAQNDIRINNLIIERDAINVELSKMKSPQKSMDEFVESMRIGTIY